MFARSAVAVLSLILVVAAQDYKPPQGVSADCASFLTSLNADAGLTTCLTSITKATKALNSTDANSAQVTSAFDGLCSDANACDTPAIRSLLNTFSQKCPDDLVNVQDVSATYDLLYNLLPMRATICTKDSTTGSYCAMQSSTVGDAQLELPDGPLSKIVQANLDALGTANTGFLFMTPASNPTALCSVCFQDILSFYVDFEDSTPYAMGVTLSPLLQGQAALWQAVTDTCGDEVAANVAVKGGAQVEQPNAASSTRAPAQFALFAAAAGVVLAAVAF